jgi:hypothetical protein
MYNYTIIAYGIIIPDDFKEVFEEYLEPDLLINPYNGNGDPESALGIEISDTDWGTDFINDILSFDKDKHDKIYKEKIKDLIKSLDAEKDIFIKEVQISNDDYENIIGFLSTPPQLIRIEATS